MTASLTLVLLVQHPIARTSAEVVSLPDPASLALAVALSTPGVALGGGKRNRSGACFLEVSVLAI